MITELVGAIFGLIKFFFKWTWFISSKFYLLISSSLSEIIKFHRNKIKYEKSYGRLSSFDDDDLI